jgi:hypothetical protein
LGIPVRFIDSDGGPNPPESRNSKCAGGTIETQWFPYRLSTGARALSSLGAEYGLLLEQIWRFA